MCACGRVLGRYVFWFSSLFWNWTCYHKIISLRELLCATDHSWSSSHGSGLELWAKKTVIENTMGMSQIVTPGRWVPPLAGMWGQSLQALLEFLQWLEKCPPSKLLGKNVKGLISKWYCSKWTLRNKLPGFGRLGESRNLFFVPTSLLIAHPRLEGFAHQPSFPASFALKGAAHIYEASFFRRLTPHAFLSSLNS